MNPRPACARRILINEINANHEAQNPQGLARNVILIRELNNNISKVTSLVLADPEEMSALEVRSQPTPALYGGFASQDQQYVDAQAINFCADQQ